MAQTYVSTKTPKRNSSQMEFLHLKLLSCTKGRSKKEKQAILVCQVLIFGKARYIDTPHL